MARPDGRRVDLRAVATYGVPAAMTAVATTLATRAGVLFDMDSGQYVQVARALRDDPSQWFAPAVRTSVLDSSAHPPGYASLLALFGPIAGEYAAARALDIAAMVVAILSVVWMVRSRAGDVPAVAAATTLLASRGVVGRVGAFLMPDAVFLAAALLSLALVDAADRATDARRGRALLVAGVAVAAGAATVRLLGVALVAAIAVHIARGAGDRRRRLALAGGALVAGSVPVGAWLIAQVAGRPGRWSGGAALTASELVDTAERVLLWFLPDAVVESPPGTALALAVLVASAVGAVAAMRVIVSSAGAPPAGRRRLVHLLAVYGVLHLAALVAARTWSDAFIVLDIRHLTPAWAATVCAIAVGWRPTRTGPSLAASGVAVLLLAGGATVTASDLADPSEAWSNVERETGGTDVLAAVRRLPAGAALISNRPDAVYLLAERDCAPLTVVIDPSTGEVNPSFEAERDQQFRRLRRTEGRLVWFAELPTGWEAEALDAGAALGLVELQRFDDGMLLGPP